MSTQIVSGTTAGFGRPVRTPDGNVWLSVGASLWQYAVAWSSTSWASQLSDGGQPTALFADAAGFLHVAYTLNNAVWYRRGTRSSGGTSWSWSAPVQLMTVGVTATVAGGLVAFQAGGVTCGAVLVTSQTSAGTNVLVLPFDVDAAGTVTVQPAITVGAGLAGRAGTLDFRHTGDGVTPSGSPDLWVAWFDGVSAPWLGRVPWQGSAGTHWAPGSKTRLSTTAAGSMAAGFDGSRFVVAVMDSAVAGVLTVYERDVADVSTTVRAAPKPANLSSSAAPVLGNLSYDWAQNLYLHAVATTSAHVQRVSYQRAGGTWGTWSDLDGLATGSNTLVTTRHGALDPSAIDLVYQGSAGVEWNSTGLNFAPFAPSWSQPDGAQDVNAALLAQWVFSDPDEGDTQSAFSLSRIIGSGAEQWWTGSVWQASQAWISSATPSATVPAGWGATTDAAHAYYVQTKDAAGVPSPKSAAWHVTPTAKVNPAITSGTTASSATYTLAWSVGEQSAYRVTGLGWDSGWVSDGSAREFDFTSLPNGTSQVLTVQTRNNAGLASNVASVTVAVSYTPPAVPTLTVTAVDGTGQGLTPNAFDIAWTDPAPSGSQPTVDHHDVWLQPATGGWADGTAGWKRWYSGTAGSWRFWTPAAGVDYTARVYAVAADGTASWVDSGGASGTISGAYAADYLASY